jgi:hypothetical protein
MYGHNFFFATILKIIIYITHIDMVLGACWALILCKKRQILKRNSRRKLALLYMYGARGFEVHRPPLRAQPSWRVQVCRPRWRPPRFRL